ncbi:hypothetical protein C9426_18205 [Serratia sp. S1B]|nr:hypothetical protein C9426_18205 [Serratia sp. S1B]
MNVEPRKGDHCYLRAINQINIPLILQVAWVLAALVHPSHIVSYAPRDSLSCRLQATRIILCIAVCR